MRAFTIATGDYATLARITAACFEWSTGLAPTIVTDCPNGPHAAKLTLPDEEPYLFFDADLLFRKKVVLPDVSRAEFAAAPLTFSLRGQRALASRFRLPRPLLSTGMFIAHPGHRAIMKRASELLLAPPLPVSGHEEPWLNVALAESGAAIQRLPGELNQQAIKNVYATTLHFCQEAGPARKLAAVRRALDKFASNELKAFLVDRRVA